MADLFPASPYDLDFMTRTMMAEDGSSPEGLTGVGNVIANRVLSGRYGGNDATSVVMAPNQFEPWSSRSAEMMGYDPSSDAYQQAYGIAKGIVSGQVPDTTGGSTHFFAPKLQADLGRNTPAWGARGGGVTIGGQVYFAPEGRVVRNQQKSPPTSAPTPAPSSNPAAVSAGDPEGEALLQQFIGNGAAGAQGTGPATTAQTGSAADPEGEALLQQFIGKPDTPAAAAAPAVDADGYKTLTVPVGKHVAPPVVPVAADAPVPNGAATAGADPDTGGAAAFVSGAINGVPIAGPYALAGLQRLSAFQRSMDNGTPYVNELTTVQNADKARQEQHPYATTAGNVAGGVVALGPVAGTELGATALGLRGASVPARAGAGALTNSLIGGADAGVRSGGDPDAIGQGAMLGGLMGSMGAGVGDVIGAGARRLVGATDSLRPAVQAGNAINGAIDTSGQSLPEVVNRLTSNPRLALMDTNNALQTQAMGLAGTPGQSRSIMNDAYQARVAGAPGAVQQAYDTAMGPTPNVQNLLTTIQDTARTNARQGFGEALRDAGPVDVGPVIQSIDDRLYPGGVAPSDGQMSQLGHGPTEQALLRYRNQLTNGDAQVVDANTLHQLQTRMRTEAETLGSSSSGQDRLTAQALRDTRQHLVGAIDDAAGGAYRPAQSQFADDMAVRDAFDQGLNIFRNRTGANGLEDRPEYLDHWLQTASPAEREAATQGARVAAASLIRTTRFSARKGTDLPDIPANFDKLNLLLGQGEGGRLAQTMNDERAIAQTNNLLFQGSQTQPRQAAQAAVAVRPVQQMGMSSLTLPLLTEAAGLGHGAAAASLGLGALKTGASYLGQRMDLARNAQMARMLSAPAGPARDEVINRLTYSAADAQRRAALAQQVSGATNLLLNSGARAYETRSR